MLSVGYCRDRNIQTYISNDNCFVCAAVAQLICSMREDDKQHNGRWPCHHLYRTSAGRAMLISPKIQKIKKVRRK